MDTRRSEDARAYLASLRGPGNRLKLLAVAGGLLLSLALFFDYAGGLQSRDDLRDQARHCGVIRQECAGYHCSATKKKHGYRGAEHLACVDQCLDQRFPEESATCEQFFDP